MENKKILKIINAPKKRIEYEIVFAILAILYFVYNLIILFIEK